MTMIECLTFEKQRSPGVIVLIQNILGRVGAGHKPALAGGENVAG
jgi:hypothetical protein